MKRILIVDDHEVLRDGVKRVLDKQTEPVMFGEASSVQDACRLACEQGWDAVVLDISLGDRSGLEVLKYLKQVRPNLPVLILSMHSEEEFARRALRAGAAGYVTKDSPRAEILTAVNKVIRGGRYISPEFAEKFVFEFGAGLERAPHEALSDREFEVLRLIASGKTVSEIANLLALSESTISTYRARILEKMAMRTSAQLMQYAIQNKLVD